MGLAVVFPTGKDARYFGNVGGAGGTLEGVLENESFHLQPFLGLCWEPNDRLFALLFAQVDCDINGNTVTVFDIGGGTPRPPVTDKYVDQTLGFIDFSLGYWVYKNPQARLLTGVAPVVELHYTTTLQDSDSAGYGGGDPTVSNLANRMDILNLTAGLHCQIGTQSTLTVAAVAPLKSEPDRQFDAEFVVEFNRRF